MRLYSGTTTGLIEDSTHNRIAGKLSAAFFVHFRYQPSPSEVSSWKNSLRAMSQVFAAAKLYDHGVMLEYQLPQTSRRLDCIVAGRDLGKNDSAVIVELKQWEKCKEAFGNKVVTFVGGSHRDVLHPSAQVQQYHSYLQDGHSVFHEDNPVRLSSCAYLHNYETTRDDPLFAKRYEPLLEASPLFTGDHVSELTEFLNFRLQGGQGLEVLDRVEKSKFRASKKLLEHVGGLLKGRTEYTLLDEQLVVFERVMAAAEAGTTSRQKAAIIIRGGPGTGKSVIALNLLSALSAKQLNTHYVTGSRSFTETMREIVGTRAAAQIKYFNSYVGADNNDVDVLICDESHRIRANSNNRFTPNKNSGLTQIEEIFRAAKVSVFFIDDRQVVRPNEVGSVELIQQEAEKHNYELVDYQLEAQFRCGGSDGFINWVDNTLDIRRTANVIWNLREPYDFQIFDTPESLDSAIRAKVDQKYSARVTAGFCWPWSVPKSDGTLVNDVVVGEFTRPWNAKPDAKHLAKGIPSSNLWAYDPNGLEQIGCIYTAQGFEFDYVGVIFGKDLVHRGGTEWIGDKSISCDTVVKRSGEKFIDLKNTYRVLLTRGMRGCYVFFEDKETECFFRSRTEDFDITA